LPEFGGADMLGTILAFLIALLSLITIAAGGCGNISEDTTVLSSMWLAPG